MAKKKKKKNYRFWGYSRILSFSACENLLENQFLRQLLPGDDADGRRRHTAT